MQMREWNSFFIKSVTEQRNRIRLIESIKIVVRQEEAAAGKCYNVVNFHLWAQSPRHRCIGCSLALRLHCFCRRGSKTSISTFTLGIPWDFNSNLPLITASPSCETSQSAPDSRYNITPSLYCFFALIPSFSSGKMYFYPDASPPVYQQITRCPLFLPSPALQ